MPIPAVGARARGGPASPRRKGACAALVLCFALIAFAKPEPAPEECDATGTDGRCSAAAGPAPATGAAGAALTDTAEDAEGGASLGQARFVPVEGQQDIHPGPRGEVNVVAVGFVLAMFGAVLLWILATIKFACDGSLPARLALWGLLPEAYAAISVRSVIALIRLKSGPTPVIVLRNCVTDEGAKDLAAALGAHASKVQLEALELPHNPQLGKEGVEALVTAALSDTIKLEDLDLSFNPQLGGVAVDVVRPLLTTKASMLSTLKLADCGLCAGDVQRMAANVEKSCLRVLDLSCNELKGGGEAIAALLEAPVLEELTLGRCDLSLADVRTIGDELPYTSLKSLQLGGNRFGSKGLAGLVENLPRSMIDELGLEANDLEQSDLASLGAAWAKRPFSRLRLGGNRMSSEEVADFVGTLRSMRA